MTKRLKKVLALLIVCTITANMLCVNANASSEDKTYINSTYGNLYGRVSGGMSVDKCFWSEAWTIKKVPKIRAKLVVQYAKSGDDIGDGDTSGWKNNDKSAYAGTYELHHFKNTENKSDYYFKKTTCIGYGTADAIVEKAYVVYTSVVV